jgi:hypothetical protein
MLLGMVAAVAASLAPALSTLACRLADPFLVGLIAVARWAAGLPGASLTLSGPLRAVPAAALAVVLAAAALRSSAGGAPGRPRPRPPHRRGGSPDPATPGRTGPRAPP